MIKIQAGFKTEKEIKMARKWCEDCFGPIPRKYLNQMPAKNQYYIAKYARFGGNFIYDDNKARWMHRYKNPTYFYFKNEMDAMAFKLRFL